MSRSNRASSQSDPDSETRKKSVQVVADDDEDDQNKDDGDFHAACKLQCNEEGCIYEKAMQDAETVLWLHVPLNKLEFLTKTRMSKI